MLIQLVLFKEKEMTDMPKSILAGVDAIIDSHLFMGDQLKDYRYKHKRSCNALSKTPPITFDGLELITAIYNRVEENLFQRPDRKPSSENWKLRPCNDQDVIKTNVTNESDEVTLERAIVQRWSNKWTYQMPVASGLFGSASDKRRAVDLVHNKESKYFDFVELKIRSDTPLYAAMEILGYGLVYLASRRDTGNNLKYASKHLPVLKAREVALCVLAPENYYRDCNLKWLQIAINMGLKDIVKNDLKMEFRFEKFPQGFVWHHKMHPIELTGNLERQHVYP